MKYAALALSVVSALCMGLAHAQTQTSKKPVAKTAAKSSTAAKSAAPARSTAKSTKSGKKRVPSKTIKAVEAHTPVQSLTQRLSEGELAIAKQIHIGKIACELGAAVTVTADEHNPGFFHITTGSHRYYMHPVESRTGAIRLEDNRAGAMWLQLGNKSMLMNQRLGQRVADECQAPVQREFAAQISANPVPGLLDDPRPAPEPAQKL